MNILTIQKCDIANNCGNGFGVSVWIAGCDLHCPGCHSPHTWDPHAGYEWNQEVKERLFKALGEKICDSITYTGGHPLMECNRREVIELAKEVRQRFPKLKQILYTGYTYEQIIEDETLQEVLCYIDILVDGAFKEELKDTSLAFRGSSNQRIIDLKKTLNYGFIYEIE